MIVYQNNFENGLGANVSVEGDAKIKATDTGNSAVYFDGDGDGLRLNDTGLNMRASDDIKVRLVRRVGVHVVHPNLPRLIAFKTVSTRTVNM